MKKAIIAVAAVITIIGSIGGYIGYTHHQEEKAKAEAKAKADATPRWELFDIQPDGQQSFIRLPYTKEDGEKDIRSTWTKTVVKSGSYVLISSSFDCKNRLQKSSSVAFYDEKGNFKDRIDVDGVFKTIAPLSVGEEAFTEVCK
jgi:hypothetical protein